MPINKSLYVLKCCLGVWHDSYIIIGITAKFFLTSPVVYTPFGLGYGKRLFKKLMTNLVLLLTFTVNSKLFS